MLLMHCTKCAILYHAPQWLEWENDEIYGHTCEDPYTNDDSILSTFK